MARLVVPATCCAVLSIGLVACSSSTEDYQKEAEKYLESDDFADELGVTFTDAECEVPPSTGTGAAYGCTAVAEDGSTWSFDVEITGKNELTVTGFVPGGDNALAPSGSIPTDTTASGSTPTPTPATT
ncbi:hypothetical protein BH24ACT5_BH24ACT5_16120 [soil metagenome]